MSIEEMFKKSNKLASTLKKKTKRISNILEFFPEFINDFDELLSQYAILAAMDSQLDHNPDCKGIMKRASMKLRKARKILKG